MMAKRGASEPSVFVRISSQEFAIPPVRDALVLGKDLPLGCEAMRRALKLLHVETFEHIEPDDKIVGDSFVRSAILKKIPKENFVDFVLRRVAPIMKSNERLQLEIEAKVITEDEL